jgi:hypothetical protein
MVAVVGKETIDKKEEPKAPVYPVSVKNIFTQSIYLGSGIIKPGEVGKATQAEASCLLGEYLELV